MKKIMLMVFCFFLTMPMSASSIKAIEDRFAHLERKEDFTLFRWHLAILLLLPTIIFIGQNPSGLQDLPYLAMAAFSSLCFLYGDNENMKKEIKKFNPDEISYLLNNKSFRSRWIKTRLQEEYQKYLDDLLHTENAAFSALHAKGTRRCAQPFIVQKIFKMRVSPLARRQNSLNN